ncbi:MAG: hypothetical protein IRY91_00460 [Gemmatimonadaceae bacterium]|nr:hypothetical protein [Gemmatimonadaceae bacterium]
MRRSCTLAVATIPALGACGTDPTQPPAEDPRAAHYDSLASVVASHDVARAAALSMIALAYHAGITPTTVTVQDSDAATEYQAAVVRTVLSGSSSLPGMEPIPDTWDIVLWQEPDGERFLHIRGQTDSVSFGPSDPSLPLLHFGRLEWGADGREKMGVEGYALLAMGDPSGHSRSSATR